jgi:hypothetical protein
MMTPAMYEAKSKFGHDIYKMTRYAAENPEMFSSASKEKIEELQSYSDALYDAALGVGSSLPADLDSSITPISANASTPMADIGLSVFAKAAVKSVSELLKIVLDPMSANRSTSSGVTSGVSGFVALSKSFIGKHTSTSIIAKYKGKDPQKICCTERKGKKNITILRTPIGEILRPIIWGNKQYLTYQNEDT